MKNKNLLWRWVLLAGLLAWSVLLAWPLDKKLPLGIDLKGGFRFVLGVDYDKLVNPDGRPVSADDRLRAQGQALEVLRNRIDSSGTREAVIYKEDSGRIIFEIPGVGDEERKALEDLIKRPAYLEFRLVHENNGFHASELLASETTPPGFKRVTVNGATYFQKDPAFTGERDETHRALVANTGRISPLYELMLDPIQVENFRELYLPVFVQINPELDGTAIQFARPDYDEYGRVRIALQLNKDGTERFYRTTRDYAAGGLKNPGQVGRRLAIVMDDTLYSAPSLNEVISGG